MSTFKGSLTSKLQQNHQFFSEDKLLQSISLVSFTKSSCSKIYKQNRKLLNNNPIFDPLPQELNNEETILNIGSGLTMEYTEFNVGAERFNDEKTSIESLSDLYALIDYHENVQFNSKFARVKDKDDKIIAINNSLEKAVVCKFKLLNTDLKVLVKFQERSNRNNERGVALQNVTIAGTPSTPDGRRYSQKATQDHQSSSTGNINTYLPSSQSSFSQDAVAGKLDMFFDNNTGKWKAGTTQILARMLEDLPPAPIEPLDGIDLVNSPVTDLLERTSKFTVAKAIALSKQQGNPYLFGPNFEECLARNKVELRVVNRSLKSFKKDEVVMLSEIGGEWIPQSFGEDATMKSPIKFGDWSFFKYIANSDSYFKDARYYTTGENIYAIDVKPIVYESQSRLKFYSNILSTWSNNTSFTEDGIQRPSLIDIYGNLLKEIVELNIGKSTPTFIPSTKFYIGSIFDQLFTGVGGYSDLTILEYVNVLDSEAFGDFSDIVGNFYKPRLFKTFWGPAYQDGFKTFKYNPNGKDNNNDLGFFGAVVDPTNEFFMAPFPPTQLAADQIDQRLLNMPAECGSIFINPFSIFVAWDKLGTNLFLVNNHYIHSPYYGTSEPASRDKIQFSPLYAEMVATRNPYIIGPRQRIQQELGVTELLGNLFDRSYTFGFDDVFDVPHVRMRETEFSEDGKGLKQAPISTAGTPVSSFDPWPGFGISSSPQGPFCVGVISAKQTISKLGGGDVNFLTNQTFGRHQYTSFTTSQSSVSIIGLGVGATAVGNVSGSDSMRSRPTWGSRVDSHSSFGTTALHVRIFDHWPEDQTLFDPRYFAVLHFNAGSYYTSGNGVLFTKTGETEQSLKKRKDEAKKLDIPIPTKDDDSLLIIGTINKDTKLKPKDKWKLNPIRRGVLLSGGGFKYKYTVIGLYPQSASIVYGGTGFNNNFEYEIQSKNVKFKFVVSGGSITSWTFVKDDLGNELVGDNFLPSDFNLNTPIVDANGNITGSDANNKGFILTITSQTSGGKSAIIKFTVGIAWLKIAKDEEPKSVNNSNPIRLSRSSQAGSANVINGSQETKVTLEKNSSGKYDCFYHFHNDLLHTLYSTYTAMPSWLQYINLTIT